MEYCILNLSEESLNSPDRTIRKEFLLQTFNSTDISTEKKIEVFKKALFDKHDSIRNLAIEYLSNTYEKSQDFNFKDILIPALEKESVWSVKYLILKKFSKYKLDMTNNKEFILKLTFELKPQVRIASAEVLLALPQEEQEESYIDRLLELWKDKDESVRKQLEILLSESENPKIKKFMAEYEEKLAEKERKKKEIAGMFEGI